MAKNIDIDKIEYDEYCKSCEWYDTKIKSFEEIYELEE